MTPEPVRVLLADDHAPTRADVAALLRADGRFEVVAEVADAPGAIREAMRSRPRLALLDVHMPGHGVAAAWEIKARLPATAVVMFTISEADCDLFAALRSGACGYLLKTTDPRRLPHALLDAANGLVALPRELQARVLEGFRDRDPRRRSVHADGLPQLTSREWEVLDLLRDGRSTAAMARVLGVSRGTVRSHVMALVRKLDVADRDAVVALLGTTTSPAREVARTGDGSGGRVGPGWVSS